MFIIIGGDGREYGPVNAEQVRAWIRGGRANLETRAKALGSDEWRRVGDFAEFATPDELSPPPIPGAEAEAPRFVLAERTARLAAWFVDNIFGFIACLPGFLLLGVSVMQSVVSGKFDLESMDTARLGAGVLALAVGCVILFGVQIWLLTTRGQTIGKRVLGIRIVRFTDHSNPGFVGAVLMRAIVPAIIGIIPYLGFIFTLVDYCFIFREDRRCIHDLIAGTKVVKA